MLHILRRLITDTCYFNYVDIKLDLIKFENEMCDVLQICQWMTEGYVTRENCHIWSLNPKQMK